MSEPDAGDGLPATPPPVPPPVLYSEPLPADDGSFRQKVLLGGVLLLFVLVLVGLGFVIFKSKSPTPKQAVGTPSGYNPVVALFPMTRA